MDSTHEIRRRARNPMFIVNVAISIIHDIRQFIAYAKISFKWSAAIAVVQMTIEWRRKLNNTPSALFCRRSHEFAYGLTFTLHPVARAAALISVRQFLRIASRE